MTKLLLALAAILYIAGCNSTMHEVEPETTTIVSETTLSKQNAGSFESDIYREYEDTLNCFDVNTLEEFTYLGFTDIRDNELPSTVITVYGYCGVAS